MKFSNFLKPQKEWERNDNKTQQLANKDYNILTKDEKLYLIDMGNQALRRIENAGMQEDSQAYKNVDKYKDKEKFYNVKTTTYKENDEEKTKTTIRFSKKINEMSKSAERNYIEKLQTFLKTKTSSVSGTKHALEKGFRSYAKKFDEDEFAKKDIEEAIREAETKRGKPLTDKMKDALVNKIKQEKYSKAYMEYRELWKIYRNNVSPDKKSKHMDSDRVMMIMASDENYGFYDLTKDQQDEAMKYFATHNKEEGLEYIKQFKDDFVSN